MTYNDVVLDCFFNTLHHGSLDKETINFASKHTQLKKNFFIELSVQVNNQNTIEKARFKAQTNPYLIAGLEWLCRQLEGEALEEHPRINYEEILATLNIPPLKYADALQLERIYQEVILLMKQRLSNE